MANEDISNLGFMVQGYDDIRQALEQIQIEFLILSKRIRVTMVEYLESIPGKLQSKLKKLGSFLMDAFRVDSLEDYAAAASIYGQELAGALYQAQLSFSGLKIAVIQAAAPLVQVLLPVVQRVIQALTGLAQSIGYVLRMLFLGTAEVEDYTTGVQGAVSATKAWKRTLAGFDEINRLNDPSSGISGGLSTSVIQPISGAWQELADKLIAMAEPLKKINFGPAAESLEKLRKALEPITKALCSGLEWAWYNIFVPLAKWTSEELLPLFLDTLTAAMETLGQVIEKVKPYLQWLWDNCLKPWAEWKAGQIIEDLQGVKNGLSGITNWAGTDKPLLDNMVGSVKQLVLALSGVTEETLGVSQASGWASNAIKSAVGYISSITSPITSASVATDSLSGSVGMLAGAFSSVSTATEGALQAVNSVAKEGWPTMRDKFLNPLTSGMGNSANSLVGVLNGVLSSSSTALNYIVRSMNKLEFTIPNWVPLLGGKTFSFNMPAITMPTIPMLAKGAVLPANKPFLAVVGDQKHGTNVEAPLSVIQEAVASVMEDYAASNLAGHQATVSVLQELLAAVLGIRVGDDTIALAVDRYNRKMAVVQGGY